MHSNNNKDIWETASSLNMIITYNNKKKLCFHTFDLDIDLHLDS